MATFLTLNTLVCTSSHLTVTYFPWKLSSHFGKCCLESDYTSMFDVAKGIMTLQSLYGIIPEIHGKGDCARKVADMLQRMQKELGSVQSCIPSSIDSLVLLDRSVDLLTPLATQLTYEGLIDELYGVKNMYVKLPPEKFLPRRQGEGPQELPTEPKRLQLSSAEELHAEIRDRNFNAVGEALSRRARNITAAFEERHQARTVGEIKQFVSRLPHMQTIKSSLATHTAIAELIQEATRSESFLDTLAVEQEFISGIDTDKVHASIEELISQRQPLERVLRLMCMQSLCSGGLKPRTLDHYRREILQAYGFEHLSTLFNLEKVGLLRGQIGGRNPFPILRKTLRLQLSEVNEKNPNDISYVYSGYAPLSVRLVQFLARPGWRSIEEVLRLLPSPEVDDRQPLPPGLAYKRGPGGGRDGESSQRVTLVFFLGGVTFAEVAALRFLAQTDDGNTDYIIGTTKLINGNTWLKSLMDTF
uniref:VPS33A core subunit of CORVET and HOPS complexes n=1 Tax=Eptatretus burgeri TaxID=7764 RepID=A0A8C4NL75_EPTBU